MLVFNPFLTAIFESQIWYFENIKYFGGREYTAQTFKNFQDYIFSKHYYCRGRCKTPRGTHENIVCIVVDGKMICFGGFGLLSTCILTILGKIRRMQCPRPQRTPWRRISGGDVFFRNHRNLATEHGPANTADHPCQPGASGAAIVCMAF